MSVVFSKFPTKANLFLSIESIIRAWLNRFDPIDYSKQKWLVDAPWALSSSIQLVLQAKRVIFFTKYELYPVPFWVYV